MDANTTPARWLISEVPSVGDLVVPLHATEADVAEYAAQNPALVWRITRVNTSTGRATARLSGGPARQVAFSSRAGGGWRLDGRWVRFAAPSTPEPTDQAAETAAAAVLLSEHRPRQTTEQAQAARAAADAADQAATELAEQEQDEAEEAAWAEHLAQLVAGRRPTHPAWLYGPAAGTEGETTYVDDEDAEPLADDAPDTTPRPGLAVFEAARRSALEAEQAHRTRCVRCACYHAGFGLPCSWGDRLAQRADDAEQAAEGALAVAR